MQPPMLLAFDGNNSPNNMWHTVTNPDAYPPKYRKSAKIGIPCKIGFVYTVSWKLLYFCR